ncbi:XRE family transcriptional regulator, partial [Vibrio anguillarum]|nr:XRE family transcriptional regulator [Vibrio anguillarum]MBF4386532.1 XRE family transcriptional regulator [Vibrio anguillarum]MBF4403063.1 XRE family transcriptional regulator [Vibrio anguillarum]
LIADELGVPLSYFFCEDDISAELVCLISKMSKDEKVQLALEISKHLNTI